MAEEVATPVAEQQVKPTASPVKMGQTLSSQASALTKLLKETPKEAPKAEDVPAEQPDKRAEPAKVDEPAVTSPAPADNNFDDYENPEQPDAKPLEPIEKYILGKLPVLTTRIKVGDEIKTVSFRDVSDLPAGFELADDASRTQFTVDVAAQVGRARDALNEYKQAELQQNIRAFEAQEAKDVAADVAYLQRTGIIDKFKYAEDDANFNSDPAVKLANDIYDIYVKTNQAYAQKFANTNRTFRISYRDAADKYFAAQSRQSANDSQKAKDQPKEVKPKQTAANKERQQVAKQTGAPAGGEPKDNKPHVRSGMKMDDINRLFRAGKI